MLWGHTTNLPGFLTLEAEGSKMRPMCRSFCSSCHFWYIKYSILFLIAKKVLYIQKKKYTVYTCIYIYVYQLATVCFLCINKIQSNIANEKLQTTHFCEKRTFDHSNRSCRAPLAVLLLKNLRGRKRCAALPKRCSPQIRKFDLLKNASKNATS